MGAREVIYTAEGKRGEVLVRAMKERDEAVRRVRVAIAAQEQADRHLCAVIEAITGEDVSTLKFDAEQGTIYRDVPEATEP